MSPNKFMKMTGLKSSDLTDLRDIEPNQFGLLVDDATSEVELVWITIASEGDTSPTAYVLSADDPCMYMYEAYNWRILPLGHNLTDSICNITNLLKGIDNDRGD